jgi:hypothetical protein
MRAYGFYFMYVCIGFLVQFLIVGFISPKNPLPSPYPMWTIEYVLWQLSTLRTMEFDAL